MKFFNTKKLKFKLLIAVIGFIASLITIYTFIVKDLKRDAYKEIFIEKKAFWNTNYEIDFNENNLIKIDEQKPLNAIESNFYNSFYINKIIVNNNKTTSKITIECSICNTKLFPT